MDDAVGQQTDEQVAFDPTVDTMVHGSDAEVGFQRAEHRLQIGQHGIDPPERGVVWFGQRRAEAIDARIGH